MEYVAGVGRRVWTIGADLADAATRTVGYARALGRDERTRLKLASRPLWPVRCDGDARPALELTREA